jgi:hypothetical protein
MVGHDHVRIDGKTSGFSSFIESVARYDFYLVSTKNRKAVFGDGGKVKSRSVSRDNMHEA